MRLRERYEMSNCPCHHIAAAFEVSLAALRRTQHRCDVSSDGRLFGNYRSGQCLSAAICCRKSARRCRVESLFGRPGQPNPDNPTLVEFHSRRSRVELSFAMRIRRTTRPSQSGGVVVCDENTGTAEVTVPTSWRPCHNLLLPRLLLVPVLPPALPTRPWLVSTRPSLWQSCGSAAASARLGCRSLLCREPNSRERILSPTC